MNKMLLRVLTAAAFIFSTSALCAASYKIENVNFNISGITKPSAITKNIPINTSKVFSSEEEFLKYISTLEQDLINTRCFEESEIKYDYSEPDSENLIKVDLEIITKDSLHFLGLPYLKYSSSNGLSLKLKAKDTNFLGSMNELNTSLDFLMKPDDEGKPFRIFEPSFNVSIDYPFLSDPVELTWVNDASISYTWGETSPEWNIGTGLKVELPLEITTLTWKFIQSSIKDFSYREFDDETYFQEYLSFSTPFKICEIPGYNNLMISPLLSVTYNWDPFKRNGHSGIYYSELQGPQIAASSELSFGRVNWIGNFRQGINASLTPSIIMNTGYFLDSTVAPLSILLEGNITAFKAFKYAGLCTQFNFFGAHFSGKKSVDQYIRGVIDDRHPFNNSKEYQGKTPAALIMNIDCPVHIFTTNWENFPITNKIGFMRHFNFELQVSPFLDVALIETTNDIHNINRIFNPKDGFYGAGLEVLVYPQKWSSYVVRGSIGVDIGRKFLGDHIDRNWRSDCRAIEIAIGLGTHY